MRVRGKEVTFFGYDFGDFMLSAFVVVMALAVYVLATTGMVVGVHSLIAKGYVVAGWILSGFFAILNVTLAVAEVALLKDLV